MLQILFVPVAGGLMLTLLWLALGGSGGGKAQARRLEAVRARHSSSLEVAAATQMRRIVAHRGDTRIDGWADRLLPRPEVLRQRLERTGRNWTIGQFGMASAAFAVVVALLLALQGVPAWMAIPIGAVAGLLLPQHVITWLVRRRVARFTAKFPDAIELLVRGLRSGLPISETLGVVGSEVPEPVGGEFRGVADRIKIGRTMDAALQDTADRLGTPEFQFFCITLAIQRETGGNLAETLSNLADVLRKRAQMKLKIRAMSSESKASAYIVGALPFIVFALIWFINGKYMQQFFTEPRLMIAGGIGLVWMAIGAFVMGKMVSFEI